MFILVDEKHSQSAVHSSSTAAPAPGKKTGNKKAEMAIYVVVAAAIIVVILYFTLGRSSGSSSLYGTNVSVQNMQQLYSIANNNTLANMVGVSAYGGVNGSSYFKVINATPLSNTSKPEIDYVGGEFCPYCAADRWALILAFMRFGNFTGLKYMASSSTDSFPNTHTFSFLNSSYSSKYIIFKGYEIANRTGGALMQINGTISNTYSTYASGIPFVDFNGGMVTSGSLANPEILSGMNWDQIIAQLSQPNSTISGEEVGMANIYTAKICQMINNASNVCSQSYVKAAQQQFFAS